MFSIPQILLLLTPALLLVSTLFAFRTLPRLGTIPGYLAGFLFYWLGWCLLLPLALLGPRRLLDLFRDSPQRFGQPPALGLALLLLPLLLGFGYAFPRAVRSATVKVLLASALLALVNAAAEEILWRGAYIHLFPGSFLWAVIYPALGFGVWHFAPQTVFPNKAPGGSLSLVIVAVVTGLLWGWVAFISGSILWTTISHLLFDFSGLGGRLYFPESSSRSAP